MAVYIDRHYLDNLAEKHELPTEVTLYATGHVYHGMLRDGQMMGCGELSFEDINLFRGVNEQSRKEEAGFQQWSNGDSFFGDFWSDRRNGWGLYSSHEGETYEGTFFQDKRHGFGLNLWNDGSYYFGTFFLDKRAGYGIMEIKDAFTFEGFFSNDLPEGPGIYRSSSGDDRGVDVGYWHAGRLSRLLFPVMHKGEHFSWMKEFPEYTFYAAVKGVNAATLVTQSSLPAIDQKFPMAKEDTGVQEDQSNFATTKATCMLADLVAEDSIPLKGLICSFPDSKVPLPPDLQVWDPRSALYQHWWADLMFHRLLHCKPPRGCCTWPKQLSQETSDRMTLELQSQIESEGVTGFEKTLTSGIEVRLCESQERFTTDQLEPPTTAVVGKGKKRRHTTTQINLEFAHFHTETLVAINKYLDDIRFTQEFVRQAWPLWHQSEQVAPCDRIPTHMDRSDEQRLSEWSKPWKDRFKAVSIWMQSASNKPMPFALGPNERLAKDFLTNCQMGAVDAVRSQLLRKTSAQLDPNVADHDGCFGLLWAVLAWNEPLVNTLLDFGANVHQVTDEGVCALSLCLLYYCRVLEQLNAEGDVEKPHVLSYTTPNESERSGTTSPEPLEAPCIRKFVYRAEVTMFLPTSTQSNGVEQAEKARLAQLRRIYTSQPQTDLLGLPKIQVDKMPESTSSTESTEPTQKLPTFKRFTNCLTRMTRQLQLSHTKVPVRDAEADKAERQIGFTDAVLRNGTRDAVDADAPGSSGGTSSEDMMALSRRCVQEYPQDPVSPVSLHTTARQLSQNEYFLAKRVISPATLTAPSRGSTDEQLEAADTDPETNSTIHQRAVLLAQKNQISKLTEQLLRRGADPNTPSEPLPCLFLAVQSGDVKMARRLLQCGADPNVRLQEKEVTMKRTRKKTNQLDKVCISAASIGSQDAINLTNAPLIPSLQGLTPLHYASMLPGPDGLQMVQILLNASADPNAMAGEDLSFTISDMKEVCPEENDPSHFAAVSEANVEQKTNEAENKDESPGPESITEEQSALTGGRTPLHLACARDYDIENAAFMVKAMLEHGANPNLMCNGHSALTLAIASGNDAVVRSSILDRFPKPRYNNRQALCAEFHSQLGYHHMMGPNEDETVGRGVQCVDVLLRCPRTNTNQLLTHGLGTSLLVACSRMFEFRRDADARINLVKKLVEIGGAAPHIRVFIPTIGDFGNIVDACYHDYMQDKQVSKVPFHALKPLEKELYLARAQIMDYLAGRIRSSCYYNITEGKTDMVGKQMLRRNSTLIAYTTPTARATGAGPGRAGEDREASTNRIPFYPFCYQCGRSVGVRLVQCAKCKQVYYCSKSCKMKAWNTQHRFECGPGRPAARPRKPIHAPKPKHTAPLKPQIRPSPKYEEDLPWSRFLLCRSAGGELLGLSHPAYQYRFLLNRYLRVNQSGRVYICRYGGEGNYSLI